jgi:hypothetical protein
MMGGPEPTIGLVWSEDTDSLTSETDLKWNLRDSVSQTSMSQPFDIERLISLKNFVFEGLE